LPVIFSFFLLQAVFYAVTIDYSIPSDEDYHYESIKYYADQPIATGPFTNNQSPDTIKAVNNIDRNPKYLYHYLLSFPQRVFDSVGMGEDMQILFFRLLSVVFALLSLLVLKKIFDELTQDRLAKNIAMTALVLTGMFVWLAASINYDNLANLLFLVYILLTIRFIRSPNWRQFALATSVGMLASLTKHNFLAMLFIGFAASAYFMYRHKAYKIKKPIKLSIVTVAVGLLFVVSAGLLAERVGGNLAQYGDINPKCRQFFDEKDCRAYRVTARNYNQRERYSEEDKTALIRDWDPFTHTGLWTYKMYNSLPWYLGHHRIESNIYSEVSAVLAAGLLAVTVLFSRRKIRLKPEHKFVAVMTAAYISAVYLVNLNTYFSIGQMNGYQGRYLLAVLGFVLLFLVTLALNSYRNMSGRTKLIMGWLWIAIAAAYAVTHFTPLIFYIGTDPSWFDNMPPPYY
jgi:uncharacterized membrane protein